MRLNRIFFSGILVLFGIIVISGCRHTRPTNTRKTPAPAPTTAAPATGPSAQSVMTHADSALARVSQLSSEDREAAHRSEQQTDQGRWASGAPKPNLPDYNTYEDAIVAYNDYRYDDAISLFSRIARTDHPPELVPRANYWMGESFYAMHQYEESMRYFEKVIQLGPEYKREISMFKLSRAAIHLHDMETADMWYGHLRDEYRKSHYLSTLRKLGAR